VLVDVDTFLFGPSAFVTCQIYIKTCCAILFMYKWNYIFFVTFLMTMQK